MRCFVAIDLPDDVRAALAAAQERLRGAAPTADVRWTSPAAMHLTLKFLGEVADADPVRAAIAEVASRHDPIVLAAGGLGAFPGPSRSRLLWAGITAGVPELGLLAADVERAVAPLGFAPEARPFRGHLTLARIRSPRGLRRIGTVLGADASSFGAWTASDVVLYRSHLRPTGSVYEPLARIALSGFAQNAL